MRIFKKKLPPLKARFFCFPEEHSQFINEIRFWKDEFSPFFDDFLDLVKMRIFQKKKIALLESLFLLLSEGVIFFS